METRREHGHMQGTVASAAGPDSAPAAVVGCRRRRQLRRIFYTTDPHLLRQAEALYGETASFTAPGLASPRDRSRSGGRRSGGSGAPRRMLVRQNSVHEGYNTIASRHAVAHALDPPRAGLGLSADGGFRVGG